MKNKLLILSLIVSSCLISTQQIKSQSVIRGEIRDIDGVPLQSANVLLLKSSDSSLVKGMVSNALGNYSFERINNGQYLITATYTGMGQAYTRTFAVTAGKKELDIETLYLEIPNVRLKNVAVVVKKPLFEQKIDRMVVNVKNSITNAGGTALDVLEKSPGVKVNRLNNTISINGKNGVIVMINGKINYMPLDAIVQMLGATSSDNIEKIEIITTPPAKYDAGGNAGYINIVLINNPYAGLSGSYFISAGYGNKELGDAGFNFNHRSAKLSLYGNYSFKHDHYIQPSRAFTQFSKSGNLITNTSFSDRDATRDVNNIRLGIDYQLNKANVIGVLVSGNVSHWAMGANNGATISKNNVPDTTITTFNHEINHWQNLITNLSFQHTFKPGKVLYVDGNYVYYKDSNPNTYSNNYYDNSKELLFQENLKSGKTTPIHFKVFSSDYTTPLGSKITMEAGIKLALSKFSNDVNLKRLKQDIYVPDSSLSTNYLLKENIGAAYASFNIHPNSKLLIKAGLRYEYTTSNLATTDKANIVERKYGKFFPTFNVSQKLNDNSSVSFSYGRRITRPAFTDLAPFTIFFDPKTFFNGNPALQPAISNSVQASYSLKKYIFSLSYSHEQNTIENFYFQTQKLDTIGNILYLSASNFKYEQFLAASFSLPFNISKWWSMQSNIIYNRKQVNTKPEKGSVRLQASDYSINTTQRFMLSPDLSFELTGFYNSTSYLGTTKFRPLYQLNAGLQKKLNNKKNILRLTANDIFNTGGYARLADNSIKGAVVNRSFNFGSLAYKLTYTHNFGNKALKTTRERSTGAEDELNRVHN